jgi:uncharacterized protein YjbI with pentapeptide repeats
MQEESAKTGRIPDMDLQDTSKELAKELRDKGGMGINFQGIAYLQSQDISGANLSGANLSDAHLRYTNLSQADLSHANLHGAHLENANLSQADLSNADLSDANLTDANLEGVTVDRGTNFKNAIGLTPEQKSLLGPVYYN